MNPLDKFESLHEVQGTILRDWELEKENRLTMEPLLTRDEWLDDYAPLNDPHIYNFEVIECHWFAVGYLTAICQCTDYTFKELVLL